MQRQWQCLLVLLLAAGCGGVLRPAPTSLLGPVRTTARFKARTAPPTYYQPTEGKQGEALLMALNAIIHPHKDLGYDGARDLMFGTIDDADGDDVVHSLYTGRAVAGVTNRRNAYDKGLNTEHTWPQSQGATGAAKSDLHHLFPADTVANGGRSNYPFGEVAQVLKVFPDVSGAGQDAVLGKDPRGRTVFEPPDRHKGDVARAILYFYTSYKKTLDYHGRRSLNNFDVERDVLQSWHRLDSVDAAERARNDAVYEVQGNRNPYVDRPEFVDGIAPVIAP